MAIPLQWGLRIDAVEHVQTPHAYGFTYQPFWAVIAKDGTLVKAGFGPSGEAELVSMLRSITR